MKNKIETLVREYMVGRLIAAIEGNVVDDSDGEIDSDKLIESVESNATMLIAELISLSRNKE